MRYSIIILFLLFSTVLIGQSNPNILSKNRWMRYPTSIENSIEQLNQGEFYGGKWKVSKHETKGGFKWVQFEIFWTSTEGKKFGFIAEDIQELKEICSRIENFYLKEYKNSAEARRKIDGIGFQPFQGEFLLDTYIQSYRTHGAKNVKKLRKITLKKIITKGWEKAVYNVKEPKTKINLIGVRLNRITASEFVKLLKEQYKYFTVDAMSLPKCNNVRLSALGAFKKNNFTLSAEKYKLYLAMNCDGFTFQHASQYGHSLVKLKNYKTAIKFYNDVDDKSIYCKYYAYNGRFYYKSAKIKRDYLNDYKGALDDINKAIALKETGGRFWVRGLIYEKLNKLDKAQKDKKYALRLDSIYNATNNK